MPFKRRSKNLNKSILTSLPGGADCVTFLPGRGGRPQDRWGDSLSCMVDQLAPNPCHDSITRLGGGVKLAWCKVSSLIDKWKVENGKWKIFTCNKVIKLSIPLLWGGRSCVSIANYRFGEGVHPVRVNTRHCEAIRHSERSEESRAFTEQQTQIHSGSFEQSSQDDRGKYNGLVATPTSLKDDCKKGKYNRLVGQPTCHSEPFLLDFQVRSVILNLNIYPSEESSQFSLDCFVELSSSRNDRKNFPFSTFNFPFFTTSEAGGSLCLA